MVLEKHTIDFQQVNIAGLYVFFFYVTVVVDRNAYIDQGWKICYRVVYRTVLYCSVFSIRFGLTTSLYFFSGYIDRRSTTTNTITGICSPSLCIVRPMYAPHKIPATKFFFMPHAMTTAVISIVFALCWPIRKHCTILLSTCLAVQLNLDNSNLFPIPRKSLYAFQRNISRR